MCVQLLAHSTLLLCIVAMLVCPYHVGFVEHFGVHPLLLVKEWELGALAFECGYVGGCEAPANIAPPKDAKLNKFLTLCFGWNFPKHFVEVLGFTLG